MSTGAYFRASVRRELALPPAWLCTEPRACRERMPMPGHRTMIEVMAAEAADETEFEMAAGDILTAEGERGREGSAPEGTSGAPVAELVDDPANADQAPDEIRAKAGDEAQVGAIAEACVEPVSRSVAGRSAAATSEAMDVTAGETATDDDEIIEEFSAALARARAWRAEQPVTPVKAAPKVDWGRVAKAMETRPLAGAAERKVRFAGRQWCDQCDRNCWASDVNACRDARCTLRGATA